MDNFMYLGSCITAGGHIAEELSMRMSKARVAFCNLRHLWRRRDVSLIVKHHHQRQHYISMTTDA